MPFYYTDFFRSCLGLFLVIELEKVQNIYLLQKKFNNNSKKWKTNFGRISKKLRAD